MKKRYLNTLKLEEVLQKLKAGQYIFVDDEDDHYITMVDDVICERSKDGWKVNKEFFMNGNCYFEEESEEQTEVTEKDVGKLCWFWNGEKLDDESMELGILEDVSYDGDELKYLSDDEYWRYHCRPLTKAEIQEFMEKAE